ncbi:MAG: hypothetical protein QOG46_2634 [Pseudonocardiales bacterium]|nr:hypothetical protein [Pseudonocardiales bacterium]
MASLTYGFCERLQEVTRSDVALMAAPAARRTLLNVLGTTVGASRHPGVSALVATDAVRGAGAISIPGRDERVAVMTAAAAIGFAAHVDDFDDTDLETVVHPGAAVLGAVLSLAQWRGSSGADVLRAFTLGCEAEMRLGRVMTPWHYDQGWHITGTCGVVGAAVAAGLLLRLDTDGLNRAVGLATSQTLGHREAFGTMLKAFHTGKAGANGVLAATLAARGVTAPADALAAPRGFLPVLSGTFEVDRLVDGFGQRWLLDDNSFKPYPCGIVCHPAIDAAIELYDGAGPAAQISDVEVRCHALVLELTGDPDPNDGLQARFSTIHGVAVGLRFGRAGLPEYADDVVTSDAIAALRRKIRLKVDDDVARDEAVVRTTSNETELRVAHVRHARGSLQRPLSDSELRDKVTRLVDPVLPGRSEQLVSLVTSLDDLETLEPLTTILNPSREAEPTK